MEIPKCEICEVRPIYYRRLRHEDFVSCDYVEIPADLDAPTSHQLIDLVKHACGGIMVRRGLKVFQQPPSGNGFIEYTMPNGWDVHTECPEAARLLREMRNGQ